MLPPRDERFTTYVYPQTPPTYPELLSFLRHNKRVAGCLLCLIEAASLYLCEPLFHDVNFTQPATFKEPDLIANRLSRYDQVHRFFLGLFRSKPLIVHAALNLGPEACPIAFAELLVRRPRYRYQLELPDRNGYYPLHHILREYRPGEADDLIRYIITSYPPAASIPGPGLSTSGEPSFPLIHALV